MPREGKKAGESGHEFPAEPLCTLHVSQNPAPGCRRYSASSGVLARPRIKLR